MSIKQLLKEFALKISGTEIIIVAKPISKYSTKLCMNLEDIFLFSCKKKRSPQLSMCPGPCNPNLWANRF
jgi:hypothetical protein